MPPNYTKNWKVRDLLDTSDPKHETPTIQIPSLRPLGGKSSVNKYREVRMVQYSGKRARHRDLPLLECVRGTGSHSKTKTQRDTLREQLHDYPLEDENALKL